MLTFASLLTINKSEKTPLFLQISTAISDQIRRGVIPAGSQLPGTRALAESLGIHRKTVVAAYEELLAQGWLETKASSGTFVSHKLPELRPKALQKNPPQLAGSSHKAGFEFHKDPLLQRPVIKGTSTLAFNDGFPDVRLAPWEALSRAFRTVVRQGYRKNLLFYSDVYGEPSLRSTMAAYLRETRGLPVTEENILITRGSTMGLYLTANLVLRPGDLVIVGEISYGSANLIFQKTGATLQSVPVDERGLDVNAIAAICQKKRVRMVYVTPHHHYPTTVTMPAERRLSLLQLAQVHGFCVLEDDYDYDFHYDCNPVLPLAGADSGGHVVYTGSLCKAISPALRIGYVAAPADLVASMGQLRRIIDRQGDQLMEAAVAILFKEGEVRRHLKKAQKTYHQRRDLFCELLKSELGEVVEFARPTGGMAVWATFDKKVLLPDLAFRAKQQGLLISDGTNYSSHLNAARLGFASVNEAEMELGMAILKRAI
ncbi:MAG: PLP-dependent aminotransferase family protein [Saprospiraceae bacterium]|nr:PLP-dependent aminotransferase family protein [Saprospiraceae bacterium]